MLLEEPLKSMQLIKLTALIELAEKQALQRDAGEPITPMPRCQDWDAESIADVNALKSWSQKVAEGGSGHKIVGLPIIVLSICWLDPDHPDRFGEQLLQLLPIFRIYAAAGPFAVLWDYASLPQKRSRDDDDRTTQEKQRFAKGLKTINAWYVHRLTTVILVSRHPPDMSKYSNSTPYNNRGWTRTERALSSIVKSSDCLLDASKMHVVTDAKAEVELDLGKLVAERGPPVSPEHFEKNLREGVENNSIRFTARADLEIVCNQYKIGVTENFTTTEGLYYARLGWDDDAVEQLCTTLQGCPARELQRLRLHRNKLTDKSANTLANAIAKEGLMPRLELLDVECNQLTEKGIYVLDLVCCAKNVRLNVDNQQSEESLSPVSTNRTDQTEVTELKVCSGPLTGDYDAVYLSTDLEPDDVTAIKAIAPRLRRMPLLCVVGQHSIDKCQLMKEILRHCGVLKATVVQGRRSEKKYPEGVERAFAPAHSVQGSSRRSKSNDGSTDLNDEARCGEMLESFLQQHRAPLAILLKPMHELRNLSPEALKKTAAVAYGSFNLKTMREAMIADAEAAGKKLDRLGAFDDQFDLLGQFKKCVMVERTNSVGRDESVNRKIEKVWKHIKTDEKLMYLVQGWQVVTVADITHDGLPRVLDEITANSTQLMSGMATAKSRLLKIAEEDFDETAASKDNTFSDLVELAKSAEKKIAIFKDICVHEGMQMPLADPLVAAILLDDQGKLGRFLKTCNTKMDAHGKITVTPDASGCITWLVSDDDTSRKELVTHVHDILGQALLREE